jgi:two-component system, sensor histidine kinase ChiS
MPNILIVDDEPEMLTILEMLYEMQGFTVRCAKDGEHALEILAGHPVDVVMTDLMMPRLDGLGLSAKLRQSTEYRDIPIILHTAAGIEVPGLGKLFDALIRKPSTFDDQLAIIETLLSRRSSG